MKTIKTLFLWFKLIVGYSLAMLIMLFNAIKWHGGARILLISIVAVLLFLIISLWEIIKSSRINTAEKILWIICLLFLGVLGGIIYLIAGRRKIAL